MRIDAIAGHHGTSNIDRRCQVCGVRVPIDARGGSRVRRGTGYICEECDVWRVEKNDASRAGQTASKRELVGSFSRFAVFAVHTRGGTLCWFVTDAESVDDVTMEPNVIGQCGTRREAMERARNVDARYPVASE